MDRINLEDLSDYQEDKKGFRDFQRPYLIPSLLGMAMALLGFLLTIAEMEASHYHHGGEVTFLDKLWLHFEGITNEAGISLGLHRYLPVIIFVGGLALFAITMLVMALATPVSSISKMKMKKYWNANPEPGVREIIYVDRSSKTYFRRVFAARNRGPNMPVT